MAESRYEKYVIRKPGRLVKGEVVVPDKIEVKGLADTGPIVWCHNNLIPGCAAGVECGIISGDVSVGTGRNPRFDAHKHDYPEMFCFMGTNPEDPLDLGAEVEFWMGEDDELEKIEINSSTLIYVPAGLAHFPMFWRNVKRPCMVFVVRCVPGEICDSIPYISASIKGRPTEVLEGKTWANI